MTTLIEIATEMKREATANFGQPIRRSLRGGLNLIALDTLHQHRLSLVRNGVTPSAKEIEVVRRDFEVPVGARLERDRNGTYFIARLIWPRGGQMSMIADEGDRVVVVLGSTG
jgi:hypothetical protein